MKRRGNGEGTILQRADGRWMACITVGRDDKGKRRRRYVYGATRKDVQKKLTVLQHQKSTGTLAATTRMTIAEFLDRWLEDSVRLKVRASTHASYKSIVETHIKPRVGGMQVSRFLPADLQHLYSELERAGHSTRTQRKVHTLMHSALKLALRWGLVVRNVSEAVTPPRQERREIEPLSPDQAAAFLAEAAADRLNALYVLAITTGMRQGELFGLRWSDVDFDAGTVSVRRTLVEIDGTFHVNEPKSAKGRRSIPLTAMALEALHEHRVRMLAEGNAGSEYVFCDSAGGPLRRQNVARRSLQPICKRADVPVIRFHDLRHTCATLLLSDNVHPKVVQEQLGHSQIAVTLDTYSHVLPSMQREAATRMDRLLKTGTG